MSWVLTEFAVSILVGCQDIGRGPQRGDITSRPVNFFAKVWPANTMGHLKPTECNQAANVYHLSERGAYNSCFRDIWGPREKLALEAWSNNNPGGCIPLRLAENSLVHEDIVAFIQEQLKILPLEHLTYNTGPRGSFRLRRALGHYFEEEFHPLLPVTPDDLFVTPGLTSAIDSVVFSICNPGDGILVPVPFYNGFKIDITHRSDAQLVGVTYDELEGYSSLDDLFNQGMTKKALDNALKRARAQGIEPRAVLISNPHNPLGRSYPVETIKEFIGFCNENDLHFISDEIYAKSVFENPVLTSDFVSALAIDWMKLIAPNRFHVLYSASKDFCANGLRIGVVYSQNKGLFRSMSSIGAFSWTPHLVQDIWAAMLENKEWRIELHKKNTSLMAENYGIITRFMQKRRILYYEMNAGLYLWTDCRRFLVSALERNKIDLDDLRVGGPNDGTYKRREARFVEIGIEQGVSISPGSIYQAREYGWFRITFTAEKPMLEEGLRRFAKVLENHEVLCWD
ncbi:1-aminocyclopropane-1-carboxylate synthase [Fusarium flagelliforme]|uniref:1-aminocyclopropane-1-carboxylate synthase n=1 Tax=Fusarium flagelliforme TaxID=2675880 RepID=UPI001E8D8656|nr:1-aminocyclopropane-1-carboxylate synthase [Fusarium flagelliforme]KAH7174936.1 1-aminocyclopropane-1-carboxylate synthase [Fusarium flagelliforme]